MTYRGEVRGGVIVLEGGVGLPEGTIVSVEPLPAGRETPAEDDVACMADLAVQTGVKDLARNADHYLYGHPKADDAR